MNKCEHGDKITIFCASDCCVWKQAAGCEFCMKKYHNHMGPTIFLSEEQIIAMVKKYTMDSSIKPKCRVLQQAIYSYFNLIKNEITSSIDIVCKNIINQIGYPYLYSNNTLSTYKRLKNKEYKKLVQKEFKNLYELSQKINEKELTREEAKIYIEEMRRTEDLLNGLEDIVKKYETIIKNSYATFSHDSSYISKINQILKSLNIDSPSRSAKSREIKEKSSAKPEMTSSLVKEKEDPKLKTLQLKKATSDNAPVSRMPIISVITNPIQRPNYSRDVSIDRKIVREHKFGAMKNNEKQKQAEKEREKQKEKAKEEKQSSMKEIKPPNNEKIENLKQQLNNKEVEINEKKRMLIEMMKQKEDSIKRTKSQLQKRDSQPSSKITVGTPSYFKREISQRSASKEIQSFEVQKFQEFEANFKTYNDESQQNSNNELDMVDSGLKQIQNQEDVDVQHHAFTQLPLVESEIKNTSDMSEVKEKIFYVPNLNKYEADPAEIHSPIFKNFNKSTVYNKPKEAKEDRIQEKEEETKKRTFVFSKQSEIVELKENQQKSLALLLKSLTLNAEQAITYLESALKYAQNNLSAAEYLTYLYLQQDKPQNSLHLCNKMLQKMQHSSQPQDKAIILNNNKAAALNILGRYSESIMLLQKCLRYRQKDYLYKNLGDAYFSISIYQKAIYNYEKALKINECYDQAQYNLGVCLYIQQNYNNAKLAIKKALEMQPQNESYLQLLFNIETRMTHC